MRPAGRPWVKGERPMYLSAPGLVCSVGMGAEAACAAMRAGIAGFEELPYRDNNGEPIIGAMVPELDSGLSRADRLVEMLALALAETLNKAQLAPLENIPLIVCLAGPEQPGGGARVADGVVGALERKLKVNFHPSQSGAIATGHTAGFRALRVARQLFQNPDIPACLLCGADSYINASSLSWLNQNWRLKTEENSDGLIPGEAGGAILVSKSPSMDAGALVSVTGLGFGHESAGIVTEDPNKGLGLTVAIRGALAEANQSFEDFDVRISDVTGESYEFRELALALARFERLYRETFPIWHPVDSIGDTGAVSGFVQIALSLLVFGRKEAAVDRILCHCAAVQGERAVASLHITHR